MIRNENAESFVPLLLTPQQAANSLAISSSLLWRLTRQGTIPSVRINRCLRYDPSALKKWVEAHPAKEARK